MIRLLQIIAAIFIVAITAVCLNAQTDTSTPSGKPRRDEDLPPNIQETLKKHEIERNKKEHEKLLERGEQALKLSEEIEKSFDQNKKLSTQDFQKLERLERLLKKIRSDLGGSDSSEKDDEEAKPSTLETAVKTIRQTAVDLFDELKKTTRYTISAIAIQTSNSMINLVRMLRFWKN